MLYMLPFLAGAFYLGTVFLKANKIFGRVYFADLSGAGLCGLAFLVAMYLAPPENLIVVPLILWFAGQPALVLGARQSPRRALAVGRGGRLDRLSFRAAAAPRHSQARGVRLQGRRLCAQVSRQPARLRARLAVRISRSLFQLVSALRARALRQRGIQPAEDAGERLSRHVYRRRGPERHHSRPAGGADGLLPLPADGLSLPASSRRPTRSWSSSAAASPPRSRCAAIPGPSPWRRETPRCSTPSAPTRGCAISPATCSTIPRCTSSTTTAGSISPTRRSATTSST